MRDAPALLWQAVVFLAVALAYALLSQALALFPYIDPAMIAALGAAGLSGAALGRGWRRAGAGCAFLAAVGSACAFIALFYDLLLLVPPARIGMVGLLLTYVEGALLGVAAHAALGAATHLWQASRRPWWAPDGGKTMWWRRRRDSETEAPPSL